MYYKSLEFLQAFVNLQKEKSVEPESADESNNHQDPGNFKEDLFISHVKANRQLYDKTHEHFRNSNVRKKTWEEIGRELGCKGSFCQKRWRTMRDRFVRELRKSKNYRSEIQSSSFFNSMLFLIGHVKSKTYSAEFADNESFRQCEENDPWEGEERLVEDESEEMRTEEHEVSQFVMEPEENSTELMMEDQSDDNSQENQENDEVDSNYQEYVEIEVQNEYGHVMEFISPETQPEEIEEPEPEQVEEALKIEDSDEIKAIIITDQFSQTLEAQEEPEPESPEPSKKRKLEANSPKKSLIPETPKKRLKIDDPEDQIFSEMLGYMLNKIPENLKIEVKTKLLQSLTEFKQDHGLC